MGVLEVHALTDASELYLLIVLNRLNRHLTAAVADSIVDLAEPTASGCPLDCVSVKGTITVLILIPLHLPSAVLCPPFSEH